MNNVLVIYHAHCMDGFAAAYAATKHFGKGADYLAANYSDAVPDVAGKHVIMLDFSYKRPVVEDMIKHALSVRVVDHHKSALEDLKDLPSLYMCNSTVEKSGCMLAWEYLFGDKPKPQFFRFISDRDTWKFEFKETKAVSEFLYLFPKSFEVWDNLSTQYYIDDAVEIGELLLLKKEHAIAGAINRCCRPGPLGVPLVNITDGLTSEVGSILAREHPFAMSYFDTSEHRIFSLRSNTENPEWVDVSEIAKSYGGGGHANAAGFSVSRKHELAKYQESRCQ